MKFNKVDGITPELLAALERMSFEDMREIQRLAIEPILKGSDVLGQSKTGSGKTLAFGIPAILRANIGSGRADTLIVAPTRELVQQISKELQQVASGVKNFKIVLLYGGVPLREQAKSFAQGADIIIATPGRLIDHLSKETIDLNNIRTVVLDEADKMLNMGFYDDIIKIVNSCPKLEQRVLFSATFPQSIEKLADKLLQNPTVIKLEDDTKNRNIEEFYYKCSNKFKALNQILQSDKPKSTLIFCNTKAEVANLTDTLYDYGHSVIDLHGDLEQQERDEAIIEFENGSKRVLVATDIASRGIDIKDIELVINYDATKNEETYTHRIGRCGRSDAKGISKTLIVNRDLAKCNYILKRAVEQNLTNLKPEGSYKLTSSLNTLCINGGKKDKLRAGDILGTLCKEVGINHKDIGKITITPKRAYVAVDKKALNKFKKELKNLRVKKRKYVTWVL